MDNSFIYGVPIKAIRFLFRPKKRRINVVRNVGAHDGKKCNCGDQICWGCDKRKRNHDFNLDSKWCIRCENKGKKLVKPLVKADDQTVNPLDLQIQCVYILRGENGAYKIGKSRNFKTRKSWFDVKLPFQVTPILLIESDNISELEAALHRKFSHKHINGEWFRLSQSDLDEIETLTTAR